MTNKLKVLVVDDSVVMRRMLTMSLDEDGDFDVVETASDGKESVAAVAAGNFDVVIMDVEMPVMDGIEATAKIRTNSPDLPIVMFSSITSSGAKSTFLALSAGANDYAPKPSGVGHVTQAVRLIRDELLAKVKGWGRRHQRSKSAARAPVTRTPVPRVRPRLSTGTAFADIIAIGISTGGPDALAKLLPAFPAHLTVPVVIVQHMPAVFTGLLAKRLDSICPLAVNEANDGDSLEAGGVWIAPGANHLVVRREGAEIRMRLNDGPPVQSCKPSVDVMFRSVADCFGSRALAAVLTGMGCDGCDGARAIRDRGGKVLIQDEATSVVWGMPGAVSNAGLADGEFSLTEIAPELTRLTRSTRCVLV